MFVESAHVATTVRRLRMNQCRPALECLESRTVPAFLLPAVYEGGPFAGEAVITELNGDGIPDIVEGAHFLEPTFSGFVRVLLGNDDGTGCGTGSFTETGTFFTAKGTLKIAAGDLNSDGHIDIVTVDYFWGFTVLFGNGDGTLEYGMVYSGGAQGKGLALGDLDNDGDLDLARAVDTTVQVRMNDGLGGFGPATSYAVGAGTLGVRIGDVDNDADADVTVDHGSLTNQGWVAVLRNAGNGTFPTAANYAVGLGHQGHTLADLDKDGDPDIATGNYVSDTVSILRNSSTGRFRSNLEIPAGDQPVFPAADDFDVDGSVDLITGSYQGADVHLLLGNGNLTFKPPSNYPAGGYAHSVASDDLNCDQYPDVVLTTGTGLIVVLLNDAIWSPSPLVPDEGSDGNIRPKASSPFIVSSDHRNHLSDGVMHCGSGHSHGCGAASEQAPTYVGRLTKQGKCDFFDVFCGLVQNIPPILGAIPW